MLHGEYCHNCGEKVISNKDFALKTLLEQAIDSITHIDSKLFKSFSYLLTKPGQLSMAYTAGNRRPFMKPFQLFILTNMLFFIFLSNMDIFRKPANWWFNQTIDGGYQVKKRVNEIVVLKKSSIEEVSVLYDDKSNTLAKGFIIVVLPVISLIMAVLNIKKKLQVGKHLIFAVHFFSFTLFFIVLWSELMRLVPYTFNNIQWGIPILLVLLIYLILSVKNFYHDKWPWAIVKSIVALGLIIITINFYRSGISILALNLI